MINLETERLRFRQWKNSDFDSFAAYFSDRNTARFVGGLKTKEEAWRLMATYIGHYVLIGYGYLAIEEKSTGKLAGCVGIWNSKKWPEPELGYWLLKDMQGKGYATEAAEKVLTYAFDNLGIQTLVSYIAPENTASQKLAERLGAIYEKDIELLEFGLHRVYRYPRLVQG